MVLPALWTLLAILVGVAFFHFRGRGKAAAAPSQQIEPIDRLLRSAFDRSPVGVGYLDPNGSWLFVNKRLASLLGYSAGELLNVPMRMLTHGDDRKREAPLLASVRSGRSNGYTIVKRLHRKSGEYRTFRVQLLRCGDDQSAVHQCTIEEVAQQATSVEQVVSALHAVEEAAVIHCDGSGTITAWTRGAERLFGRTEAEVLGRPWHSLHDVTHSEITALLTEAAQSGKAERTVSRKRPDGTVVNFASTIVPYSLMHSTGFVEICREETTASFATLATQVRDLTAECATLREQDASNTNVIASLRTYNAELARKLRVLASGIKKLMAEREAAGLPSLRPISDPAITPIRIPAAQLPDTIDEAIRHVVEQHRSGTLAIRATDGEQHLEFDEGRLIAFSSGRKENFLGQLLVDGGVITEEQRVATLDDHRASGRPFGSSLLHLGFATAADLATVIRTKAQRELAESINWEGSTFVFTERSDEGRGLAPVSIDVLDILSEIAGEASSENPIVPASAAPLADVAKIPVRSNGNGHYYVARALGRSTSSSRTPSFHAPDCTSARTIPQQSLVRFDSVEEAAASRYIPCKRCIGQMENRA